MEVADGAKQKFMKVQQVVQSTEREAVIDTRKKCLKNYIKNYDLHSFVEYKKARVVA